MKFVHLIVGTLLPCAISATLSFNLIRRSPHVTSLVARQIDTCPTGTFPCSDGGCCATGSTCASDSNGNQICQSLVGCLSPPVPCGPSCCDAGTTCVMEGTQFRCALQGGAPAAGPPAPAPAGTDTVSSIPTGLVTATGTAGDGSAVSSVPFIVNGPVPGATGTTSAGSPAAATTSAGGATHVATTSLATRNFITFGSAVGFALAAWIVLGRV